MTARGPPYISMHWRRFAVADIPLDDPHAFDAWLLERWREKDELLAYHAAHGTFPGDAEAIIANGVVSNGAGPLKEVCTSVRPNGPLEFIQIFVSALAVPIVWRVMPYVWAIFKVVLFIGTLGGIRL